MLGASCPNSPRKYQIVRPESEVDNFISACTVYCVIINLKILHYVNWHLYTAHALNLHLHISALHGCRRKGVFTLVKNSVFETVHCVQNSHVFAHVLKFQLN
jgi:hypothetical protein